MTARWLTRVLVLSALVVPLGLQVSPAHAQPAKISMARSSAVRSSKAGAPTFQCSPQLQTACSVVGLVLFHFHACYATPASRVETAEALRAFARTRMARRLT